MDKVKMATQDSDKLKFIEQYEAVRKGAGLIELSANGRFFVGGTEAVIFLNGLISNDMKTLPENRWMRAFFPTVQGRLIALCRVVRLGDEGTPKGPSPTFLLETEAATREKLLKTIERFTMAGDFRVSDITDTTTMLSLQGPKAIEMAHSVLGDQLDELPYDGAKQIDWKGNSVTAIRSTHTVEDGIDLIVDQEHGESLRAALCEAGAVPISNDAFEVLRIEGGIPRYGHDMDDTNVIPEIGLEDAISYTKGCYIGQEIVIRIKHRGHVAKKLCKLTLQGDQAIAPGATITSLEGADIGRVTSAAFSPQLKATVALGYVRYEHSAPGTDVKVVNNGVDLPARVTA